MVPEPDASRMYALPASAVPAMMLNVTVPPAEAEIDALSAQRRRST